VYVPTNYPILSGPVPLVIAMHGFTQTAANMMAYSNFNAVAEANNFIVVYPNGTGFLPSWNSTIGSSGVNDFGFIDALVDSMQVQYNINANRIYACGFSNGGYMSHSLACTSNKFAAIASVSGTMTDSTFVLCNPLKKIPVLQIHGTADVVVNYNGAAGLNKSVDETVALWNTKNNCPTTPTTNSMPDLIADATTVDSIEYSPCASNTAVQLLKVNNGGHQWPGALSNSGLGIICKDIQASKAIWNFFSKTNNPNSINENTVVSQETIIYPTISTNQLFVKTEKTYFYTIMNLQGNVVQKGMATNSISLQNFTNGFYKIILADKQGNEIFVNTFIKE
jgi:polyhydroxybutyrate depolymerase